MGCRRLLSLACVAAAVAGAALAPPSTAAERSKRDRSGDVEARGLSPAERRALDVVGVTTQAGGAGLIVRVALRGDFDAAVGRGHLRTALAGVVLQPRSRRARPLAIVSVGAGRREDTVASRGVRGPELAVRGEREIAFFAPGVDASTIRSVQARTFASRSRRGSRSAQLGNLIAFFLGRDPSDESPSVFLQIGPRSCDAVDRNIADTERALDQARQKRAQAISDRRRIAQQDAERTIASLEAALVGLERERAACAPPGQAPPPTPPGIQGQGSFAFDPTDLNEVFLNLVFGGPGGARAAQAGGVDALRIAVPAAADGSTRTIVNFVPDPRLPSCANDGPSALVCQGGTLPYGAAAQLKLRTFPAPAAGMGGELFGRVDGTFRGPIAVTGP